MLQLRVSPTIFDKRDTLRSLNSQTLRKITAFPETKREDRASLNISGFTATYCAIRKRFPKRDGKN